MILYMYKWRYDMKAEIITVGTELLIGDVIDTNSEYISKRLAELGINCYFHSTVGDNELRLTTLFKQAMERSDVVLLSGGLGPTYDDMTKEIVAKVMGLEMEFHEESYQRIVDIFKQSKRLLTENNRKQAYIPKGAQVLTNYNGTAPGILIEKNSQIVVLLPGPPHELKDMFERWVVPFFHHKTGSIIVSRRVYLFDIGESYVEQILKDKMIEYTNPTIAPYSGSDGIYLRITASAENEAQAYALIEPVIDEVKNTFKDFVYSVDIPTLAETVVQKLKSKNMVLASAESCTGGLLGKRITDIPGSSSVYQMGLITYSNEAKMKLLNVDESLLSHYGAVSKETVEAMARSLLNLSASNVAVAISGIAGPTGGTHSKPVGLVYICVKTKDATITKQLMLSRSYQSDRSRIRSLSVSHALKMILDII